MKTDRVSLVYFPRSGVDTTYELISVLVIHGILLGMDGDAIEVLQDAGSIS